MEGYEVFEACDGLEALAKVNKVRPNLLVLDLGMPGLDGFGVIREIRANPRLAGLPVLAATAYAMRGDREKVLEAGFDGYVSKPINPATLKDEIRRLMGSEKALRWNSERSAGASS